MTRADLPYDGDYDDDPAEFVRQQEHRIAIRWQPGPVSLEQYRVTYGYVPLGVRS